VASCGGSVEGQKINTLTCVYLSTGWIECLAIHQRTQQAVFEAICTMRTYLPYLSLGLDSDNGGEFTLGPDSSAGVNDLLLQSCQYRQITFSRSRLCKKNDQVHLEQNIWSIVRCQIG